MMRFHAWLALLLLALTAAAITPAFAADRVQIGVFRDGHWFLDANGNETWDGTPDDLHIVFGAVGDLRSPSRGWRLGRQRQVEDR